MWTIAAILLFSVTLAGCSTMDLARSLFVSGISLEVLGAQFVQTTEQVTAGCDTRVIPVTTCSRYRAFGENFKRVYPLTVGMWQAANKAGDKATQAKAEDVARALARDLAVLAAEALDSFNPQEK